MGRWGTAGHPGAGKLSVISSQPLLVLSHPAAWAPFFHQSEVL